MEPLQVSGPPSLFGNSPYTHRDTEQSREKVGHGSENTLAWEGMGRCESFSSATIL